MYSAMIEAILWRIDRQIIWEFGYIRTGVKNNNDFGSIFGAGVDYNCPRAKDRSDISRSRTFRTTLWKYRGR